jgi:hypothetical protein
LHLASFPKRGGIVSFPSLLSTPTPCPHTFLLFSFIFFSPSSQKRIANPSSTVNPPLSSHRPSHLSHPQPLSKLTWFSNLSFSKSDMSSSISPGHQRASQLSSLLLPAASPDPHAPTRGSHRPTHCSHAPHRCFFPPLMLPFLVCSMYFCILLCYSIFIDRFYGL